MDKQAYLHRFQIFGETPAPTLQNLCLLQRRHLLNIPFENLDIHWQRPIILDTQKFYEKIVGEKRGGFCYELNGLFNDLLQELGYHSRLISARVYNGSAFTPEYDHLAILTKVDNEEFLVDAGFGNFAAGPLKFVLDIEQTDANGWFFIRKYDEKYFEVVKRDGENLRPEYIFTSSARDLSEFAEMCNYHQTSPESHFRRGKLCSIMTETGRKTLTGDKFIETSNGVKSETAVNSDEEFDHILERKFQIKRNF